MRRSRLALTALAAGGLVVSCAAAGYLRGRRAAPAAAAAGIPASPAPAGIARYDPGMGDSTPLPGGRAPEQPEHDDECPVAVANCVGGPAGLAGWVEEMFSPFTDGLTLVPGFREFRLREIIHGGPDRMYVSVTVWNSFGCFQAWSASPEFRAAHAAAEADPERFTRLRRACRYNLPLPGGRVLEDLNPVILSRAASDYPLVTDPSGFRDVLHRAAASA